MNAMSGTPTQNLKDGNKLEFVVRKDATRPEIKKAFEERFEAKVAKVNVRHMKDGKHAIIKLKEGYSAEEIGMRIGIF
jgi:large subunit ribosomal protein L23